MKTAIKLVLIYFFLLQVVSPFVVAIPCALLMILDGAELNPVQLMAKVLLPAQLVGMALMMLYLWRKKYLSAIRVTKPVVTPLYCVLAAALMVGCAWLISMLMSLMPWVPNIMEDTFSELISTWLGIFVIALAGPVVEEYVFRGAIARSLLKQYSPTTAILISAAIFGVFHINPAQILPAFLIGIVFGWVYYRTASLIPVIVMHVVNNSVAAWLMVTYPDVTEVNELVPPVYQIVFTCIAAVVVVLIYGWMRKIKADYNWEENATLTTKEETVAL